MTQGELLAHVARLLDDIGIPYMVVGSLAASFHGEPRTTRDIDIVVDPTAEALRRFVEAIPDSEYYLDPNAALEAFNRRTSFNVIHRASGWKVDLLVRKDRPFSRSELDRRLRVQLLNVDTHVATAEDTVVSKLEWAKAGDSERQVRDVAGIIAVSGDRLDGGYLARWIAQLDLEDVWSSALVLAHERDATED